MLCVARDVHCDEGHYLVQREHMSSRQGTPAALMERTPPQGVFRGLCTICTSRRQGRCPVHHDHAQVQARHNRVQQPRWPARTSRLACTIFVVDWTGARLFGRSSRLFR